MDALDGLQDLAAQAQGGADAEGPAAHAPPQVGQVAALTGQKHRGGVSRGAQRSSSLVAQSLRSHLQLHHHVVKAVVAATAHEAAHVVFT